jgi:hypothetical protein
MRFENFRKRYWLINSDVRVELIKYDIFAHANRRVNDHKQAEMNRNIVLRRYTSLAEV